MKDLRLWNISVLNCYHKMTFYDASHFPHPVPCVKVERVWKPPQNSPISMRDINLSPDISSWIKNRLFACVVNDKRSGKGAEEKTWHNHRMNWDHKKDLTNDSVVKVKDSKLTHKTRKWEGSSLKIISFPFSNATFHYGFLCDFLPSSIHAHVTIILGLMALGRTFRFNDGRQRIRLLKLGQYFIQNLQWFLDVFGGASRIEKKWNKKEKISSNRFHSPKVSFNPRMEQSQWLYRKVLTSVTWDWVETSLRHFLSYCTILL